VFLNKYVVQAPVNLFGGLPDEVTRLLDNWLARRICPSHLYRNGRLGDQTVIVYPLTDSECRAIRWAARVMPIVAGAIIVLLGVFSVANAAS
jgi:hypothetical protein